MTFVPKPYTGSLFVNDKKEKETHPDWRGSITLEDGKKLWVSGWNKSTPNAGNFISLALNIADEAPKQEQAQVEQPIDEIAF